MLAVSVELLHGVFRGDPDGTANTALLDRGEWPPSPARLFAAFVAADGTGDNCRVTDGTELQWLERLTEPVIHADPDPWHQRLQARYVVVNEKKAKNNVQEYVVRGAALVRPGIRVTPSDPRIVYAWNVKSPSRRILDALRRRAARIGYFGTSDSPVRVRVTTKLPSSASTENAFVPGRQGDLRIAVTKLGTLQILDRLYDQWQVRGPSVTRAQFPALRHLSRYHAPRLAYQGMRGRVVAWLRVAAPPSGRRVAILTSLFKNAVLSKHQQLYGEPPPVLHGHGYSGKGYELARFLALPDVGFRWSDGRIHGLALWMPPSCEMVVQLQARDSAFAIQRLKGSSLDVSVAPRDDEAHPYAINPDRWCGDSRRWVTVIPAIHERRGKLNLKEVARWCQHAGLPSPIAFRSVRSPLIRGAIDLAPVEVNRPGRPALPYSHVEILFARSVRGPVVLGSGRQRGFGLCVPVKA